jgi:mercuric reductase
MPPLDHCCTASSPLHIAIIGSGSAAFAAALEASERGARVTLIESRPRIGGSCVNVGCVPSKIMIRAAQIAHEQQHPPFSGIASCEPAIDRERLAAQIRQRVDELREAKYEKHLQDQPAIRLLHGRASFIDTSRLRVASGNDEGDDQIITFDRALIATGASPVIPDIPGLADSPFWTSTEALFATETPQRLIVIGSSVIALELAQAWQRLGASVSLLARNRLLKSMDPEMGTELKRILEGEGMEIIEHAGIESVRHDATGFTVITRHGEISGDRLLVATGRRPATEALNLQSVGVETSPRGGILVNDRLQTSVENIHAAGDCCELPQYVYVAAAAGTRAAINMTGGEARLDLSILPAVIFTDPQIATVGLDERQAAAAGIDSESRLLPMTQVPRALANFDSRGFIKLIAERKTGRLIGARILAGQGGEIIQTAAIALRAGMSVDDLAGEFFPYLTMAEGLKLCAQTFSKDVSRLSCCAG